ncbi:hypothetical protein [Sphingomonas crocodyli]|uniref:hypothetical protein n=1 Tax=Sphingomonas crocodyli TaxID=1979270 RepID=UPI0013E2B68F|nr:hypothetical protein [Sphingomonas crocodyli]
MLIDTDRGMSIRLADACSTPDEPPQSAAASPNFAEMPVVPQSAAWAADEQKIRESKKPFALLRISIFPGAPQSIRIHRS